MCAAKSEADVLRVDRSRTLAELNRRQLMMRGICARARNHYSSERLKEDFKEGMVAVSGGLRG